MGDEAEAWFKKNPRVEACVDGFAHEAIELSPDFMYSYETYGQWIQLCAAHKKAKAGTKMRGDILDNRFHHAANSSKEERNKRSGKDWQDEDGFMHYNDGTMSNHPID
jgi:hypothetical protein